MHTITPVEAHMLLEKYQAILIDVRERSEYTQEHIPYAISLPLSDREDWLPWLCRQEPQVWIISCLKGSRSLKVAQMLHEQMTPHPERRVYVMNGGLTAWVQEGLPTLKSKDAVAAGGACPAYRDPIQRIINAVVGCTLLISSYYVGVNKGYVVAPILFNMGAGLLMNACFAWCGAYKFLSYWTCKR